MLINIKCIDKFMKNYNCIIIKLLLHILYYRAKIIKRCPANYYSEVFQTIISWVQTPEMSLRGRAEQKAECEATTGPGWAVCTEG